MCYAAFERAHKERRRDAWSPLGNAVMVPSIRGMPENILLLPRDMHFHAVSADAIKRGGAELRCLRCAGMADAKERGWTPGCDERKKSVHLDGLKVKRAGPINTA